MSLNTWGTADLFRRLKELEDQNAELVRVLSSLLECASAAIKAGDWKVDGACDPDLAIMRATSALAKRLDEPNADDVKRLELETAKKELTEIATNLYAAVEELEAKNAELLEALEAMLLNPWASVDKAKAVIAKHKGGE